MSHRGFPAALVVWSAGPRLYWQFWISISLSITGQISISAVIIIIIIICWIILLCFYDGHISTPAAQMNNRRFMFTHHVVALSYVKWRHGRHLEIWHHIRNQTLSVNAYLLEEQSRQISSWSELKRRSLGLFWRWSPDKKNKKRTIWDQFLI